MSQQERVRYHEYMRPRYANPTYASSSVAGSLSMPLWPPAYQTKTQPNEYYGQSNYGKQQFRQPPQNYPQPELQPKPQNSRQYSQGKQFFNQAYNPQGKQRQYTDPQRRTPSQPKYQQNQPMLNRPIEGYQPPIEDNNRNGPISRLSSLGSSSLQRVPQISQREIYEKQQSKYNIINIQPKQYNETIKKYPKYRLQNQDVNYFKKIQLQNQYHEMRNSGMQGYSYENQNQRRSQYPSKMVSPRQQMPADQYEQIPQGQAYPRNDSQQYAQQSSLPQQQHHELAQNNIYHQGQHPSEQHFRPKFLNNVDEMRGII